MDSEPGHGIQRNRIQSGHQPNIDAAKKLRLVKRHESRQVVVAVACKVNPERPSLHRLRIDDFARERKAAGTDLKLHDHVRPELRGGFALRDNCSIKGKVNDLAGSALPLPLASARNRAFSMIALRSFRHSLSSFDIACRRS